MEIEKHKTTIETATGQELTFDYIVNNTEQEALILENELIKLHTPKYNIKFVFTLLLLVS